MLTPLCAGFALGAAHMVPGANVFYAFGVIAMVAMAPVLSLMIVGAIFRHKEAAHPKEEAKHMLPKTPLPEGKIEMYDCVVAIINRGLAQRAVELAREVGAGGATILHGSGSGTSDMRLFSMDIKEKEMISGCRYPCEQAVPPCMSAGLGGEGGGTVSMMPPAPLASPSPSASAWMRRRRTRRASPTAGGPPPADVATEDGRTR